MIKNIIEKNEGIIQEKTFGGNDSDVIYKIIIVKDGNIVGAGYTKSKEKGHKNAWIVKFRK